MFPQKLFSEFLFLFKKKNSFFHQTSLNPIHFFREWTQYTTMQMVAYYKELLLYFKEDQWVKSSFTERFHKNKDRMFLNKGEITSMERALCLNSDTETRTHEFDQSLSLFWFSFHQEKSFSLAS